VLLLLLLSVSLQASRGVWACMKHSGWVRGGGGEMRAGGAYEPWSASGCTALPARARV
jgi:hypothetical protein